MNAISASPADKATDGSSGRILVWDAPVRLVHWLIVLCFAGAYLTSESERWRLLHVTLGYTMGGLVVFRVLWGLIGTRYARFSNFVKGSRAAIQYFGALVRGRPEHHVGHNPAGALAIVALLTLALLVTAAGWATYNDLGGEWLEELHEGAANVMLALIGVHVLAVALSSRLHGENLVHAMITGRKAGRAEQGIRNARLGVAVLMLVAVLGFWWLQWRSAPSGLPDDHDHDSTHAVLSQHE